VSDWYGTVGYLVDSGQQLILLTFSSSPLMPLAMVTYVKLSGESRKHWHIEHSQSSKENGMLRKASVAESGRLR
jgi:hypothetical protein